MVGIFQFSIKFNINKVVIVKFATVLLCTKKENVLLPGPIGPRTLSHSWNRNYGAWSLSR